jgi:K+-transporting ATPase ATPase A chain
MSANTTTAVATLLGRYALIAPALLLAGKFAMQGRFPSTAGTLRTDSLLFGAFLIGMVLIVTGLSYLPGLTLGPVAEHILEFAR